MEDLYLFVSSGDSRSTHENNVAGDFTVNLPRPHHLCGSWECALKEITFVPDFETSTDRIYVCTDLVEDSYVKNTSLSVLRSIDVGFDENRVDLTFESPFYFKMRQEELRQFRIFLLDGDLKPCRFKIDRLYCTLHLRYRHIM